MKYHITLDLAPNEIVRVKVAAVYKGWSVKYLVKRAIEGYLKVIKEDN